MDSLQDDLQLGQIVSTIRFSELPTIDAALTADLEFSDFGILQLSSGTTGYRKAIEFRSENLLRHVTDFNQTLSLTSNDVIVSWLPLYHDMGFIACFVMPLLLGIDVVMMDPITWVEQPGLLFAAIEQHSGTICYMPNFGFEVMSRQPRRSLPTVRWWVSCSEPISPQTAVKFMNHISAPEDSFAACYAMAENIFAVSLRRGIHVCPIDGTDVVSCGTPIHGVEVKTVEGEVWVKSPVSLQSYVRGDDIRDAEGFYPTGDIGAVINGELYIVGRKYDIMIQAGRKFFLSDIDLRLNELFPEIRGRAAALNSRDERLETEVACVLIEAFDFYRRTDQADIETALKSVTGIDQLTVHFVPPRFLTKTTSGKINRKKSLADWQLVRSSRALAAADPIRDLEEMFGNVAWDKPVSDVLDSLSLTILQMITSESGIVYDGDATLTAIRDQLAKTPIDSAQSDTMSIRIVSIGERTLFNRLTKEHLETLSKSVGLPVTFQHVCVPPSAILLSDLIFSDYFAPRLDSKNFAAVNRALNIIRNASLLVMDDAAEMFFPPEQVYGVLSHNMERDPRADLLAVRWQNYAQMHDRLPLTVVRGGDIPLTRASQSTRDLGEYLSIPIFRIANLQGFASFTEDWEWRPMNGNIRAMAPDKLVEILSSWISGHDAQIPRRPLRTEGPLDLSDAIYFCSHAIKREPIDLLLSHFDRIGVAGRPASVPYIRKRLEELNRPIVYLPSYAPEIVTAAGEKFDCILICGAMGNFQVGGPAVALQHVGQRWRTKNLEPFGEKFAHLNTPGIMEDSPKSGAEWHYDADLVWGRNYDEWRKVRSDAAQGKPA